MMEAAFGDGEGCQTSDQANDKLAQFLSEEHSALPTCQRRANHSDDGLSGVVEFAVQLATPRPSAASVCSLDDSGTLRCRRKLTLRRLERRSR